MHSKIKGNIGQFTVAAALAKLGFSVFSEEGDISKIDLIAEKNGKLLRFQCKAITPINNKICLLFNKSGPNYKFIYKANMFDYFGVCDLSDGAVYAINSNVLNKAKRSMTLRKRAAKNNQTKRINAAENYLIDEVFKNWR